MREKRLALRFALLLLTALLGAAAPSAQTSREVAPEDYIRNGNKLYQRAEYASAIAEYRRVTPEAGAPYAQSLYNMGVCYYELWRTPEAITMYRRAIAEMKGDYPAALYALGVALKDSGQKAEAREAYKRAITASAGKHVMAHYMLGLLSMNEGSHEAAADLFREAIQHSSKGHFPASHNNLGVMLARLGRLAEAQSEFELALKQTRGEFAEATHNLKLCRTLLTSSTKAQLAKLMLASLRTVEAVDVFREQAENGRRSTDGYR